MKKVFHGIDWLNHVISFLSALIGIIIAFQLEDYKDNREETKDINNTLAAVKTEIENNMAIYSANVEQLSAWLNYYNLLDDSGDNNEVQIGKKDFEKMKTEHPERLKKWILKSTVNDTTLVFNVGSALLLIDIAPQTGISTSSWQAGLYSGTLNKIDHKKLARLNQIYEWTTKDIGLNEREFYGNLTNDGIDDFDAVVSFYSKIVNVDRMRLTRIKSYYDDIDWSSE